MTGPVEPSADTRGMAHYFREIFLALVAEGFTEHQALVIIGQLISRPTDEPPA